MNPTETILALIREALAMGCRIDLSITPPDWTTDDDEDPATIHADIPTTKDQTA